MPQGVALVTGFQPYGGRGVNPSAEVAQRLNGSEISSVRVVGVTLPVSFASLRKNLQSLIDEVQPQVIINLGLWPGEPMIRLERVAINIADFEIPDNEGCLVQNTPLDASGLLAVPSTLPLEAVKAELLRAGIPARISNTAGLFLCNATMYSVAQFAPAGVPSGFVHLPYLPEQVAELLTQMEAERTLELHQRADLASMSLDVMVEAIRIALSVAIRETQASRM